jgi:methyltransferase (TIGR00027 family)
MSVLQRPSRTARAAALGRAVGFAGHRDTWAEQVLPWRDAVLARRMRRLMGADAAPGDSRVLRPLLGGLTAHATLRMVAIDECVRQSIEDGIEQVVIVGAGLDTRAWRLDELAAARVLELDLPGTQEAKQLRLAGTPARAAQVDFVPVDLHRADLDWVLGDAGHDRDAPTLWLWEAVAMYIPPASVHATAEVLGARSAAGSRLAMTFVVPDLLGEGRVGRALAPGARALFDALGEPVRTALTHDEVVDLLRDAGFDRVEISDSAAWARSAGLEAPRNPLGAERLAVATRTAGS